MTITYISLTLIKLQCEKRVPIVRKLIDLRTSKGITLPKSWLENAEQEAGKKIIALALEVDRIITVTPVFEKKKEEDKSNADQS